MSPPSEMPTWTKSPTELQAAFRMALERFPAAEQRPMFGYPAAFANGNMWTSLHQASWVVRLPDPARTELLAIDSARPFEPMPGRSMAGYATLPPAVLADPVQLHGWLTRAWEHALGLPPKETRTAKAARPKG